MQRPKNKIFYFDVQVYHHSLTSNPPIAIKLLLTTAKPTYLKKNNF
jgi:hypothetical protein